MPKQKRDPKIIGAVRAERAKRGVLRCEVCNWGPPPGLRDLGIELDEVAVVHGHHITPIAYGGPDTAENIVLLCPNHHLLAHKIGPAKSRSGKTKYWGAPATREGFLYEMGLLQSSDRDTWKAYLAGGRDPVAFQAQLAEDDTIRRERRFTVLTGGQNPERFTGR